MQGDTIQFNKHQWTKDNFGIAQVSHSFFPQSKLAGIFWNLQLQLVTANGRITNSNLSCANHIGETSVLDRQLAFAGCRFL